MWLTGFDVPSMATMFIDKPMKGHNLMQAITRVNCVYNLAQAYRIALEKLEIMRDLFYGFDYSNFFGTSDKERYSVMLQGLEFAFGFEEEERKILSER